MIITGFHIELTVTLLLLPELTLVKFFFTVVLRAQQFNARPVIRLFTDQISMATDSSTVSLPTSLLLYLPPPAPSQLAVPFREQAVL